MIIRAGIKDAPRVVELGMRFMEAAGVEKGSYDSTLKFAKWLIEQPNGVVFLGEKGCIGGYTAPLFYTEAFLQAHECFWWSEGSEGLKLMNAFEKWANEEQKADEVLMSMIHGYSSPTLERFFERKGYKKRDVCFVKKGL